MEANGRYGVRRSVQIIIGIVILYLCAMGIYWLKWSATPAQAQQTVQITFLKLSPTNSNVTGTSKADQFKRFFSKNHNGTYRVNAHITSQTQIGHYQEHSKNHALMNQLQSIKKSDLYNPEILGSVISYDGNAANSSGKMVVELSVDHRKPITNFFYPLKVLVQQRLQYSELTHSYVDKKMIPVYKNKFVKNPKFTIETVNL